jgi:primase-polymerase (primpol)-like protein
MHNYDALRAAFDGPFKPLTQYRQFMLWQLQPDPSGGKPRKMPYRIDGGQGSSTDPTAWVDADTALSVARSSGMGVAFVVTDADPFVFIDVDNCVSNGQWDADALDAFGRFPGAAFEASQSGTGMHLFVAGDTPAGYTGRKRGKFECYRTGRFIALTGNMAQGTVYNFGATLASFIADKFPANAGTGAMPLTWTTQPIPEWSGPDDDEELLRQFLSAPAPRSASEAFAHLSPDAPAISSDAIASNADLFNANVAVLGRAYPADNDTFDHSNAAFALACRLAYWTGKDCERIERLMSRAAFRRGKAYEQHDAQRTYMQWDIERACAMTTKVMFQRASALNAEVVADGAAAYDEYFDRISAAADVHAVRAVASEVATDLRVDPTLREMLAGHVQKSLNMLGNKLKIDECRKMVAQKSARPAADLRELTRQTNIALNLPEETVLLAPVMSIAQMIEQFVFISDGSQVGNVYDRYMNFALADFRNTMAASYSVMPDGKTVEHTQEWLRHNTRKLVQTRTFHAGANIITSDPNGRSALNMWRPIERGSYTVDVTPFYEHVQYLFGADTERFIDWLAHIEQQPGVLPHFGWLHIADHFGTGRNWLASVISRLWRGYVAPSVDMDALIQGGFNGALAGRVIAIVDEIRAGAREDAYMMEGKIRNMLTEETRYIKPKYGREYVEHNACRWLLFSNHKNAIPMDDNDRRWYVVHLSAGPRAEHIYSYLYGLLEQPGFIDSLAVWLRGRDLSAFNPGQRPPVTEAKQRAIAASKSDFQRVAGLIVKHWPCDFITVSDLSSAMFEGDVSMAGKRLNAAMKHALDDAGLVAVDKQIYDELGNKHRVWIVRNSAQWLADMTVVRTGPEFMKLRPHVKGTGYQTLSALL